MYINKITGDYIQDSAIIKKDDSGLVYYENGCWKYLSKNEYADSETDKSFQLTEVVDDKGNVTVNGLIPATDYSSETLRYYTYYFGLNEASFGSRIYAETSAIMTDVFDLTAVRQMILSASENIPDGTSIEYSVVSNNKETPILPQETKQILHERYFFGLKTRFPGTDKTYYKDYIQLPEKPEAMDEDSVYTVSYTPTDGWIYNAAGTSARIKVLLRMNKFAKCAPSTTIRISRGV